MRTRGDPQAQRTRRAAAAKKGKTISASIPADDVPADAVEQQLPADASSRSAADERFREAAEADLAEQERAVLEQDDTVTGTPLDADPLDAADQRRSVPLDDEDYR